MSFSEDYDVVLATGISLDLIVYFIQVTEQGPDADKSHVPEQREAELRHLHGLHGSMPRDMLTSNRGVAQNFTGGVTQVLVHVST